MNPDSTSLPDRQLRNPLRVSGQVDKLHCRIGSLEMRRSFRIDLITSLPDRQLRNGMKAAIPVPILHCRIGSLENR